MHRKPTHSHRINPSLPTRPLHRISAIHRPIIIIYQIPNYIAITFSPFQCPITIHRLKRQPSACHRSIFTHNSRRIAKQRSCQAKCHQRCNQIITMARPTTCVRLSCHMNRLCISTRQTIYPNICQLHLHSCTQLPKAQPTGHRQVFLQTLIPNSKVQCSVSPMLVLRPSFTICPTFIRLSFLIMDGIPCMLRLSQLRISLRLSSSHWQLNTILLITIFKIRLKALDSILFPLQTHIILSLHQI